MSVTIDDALRAESELDELDFKQTFNPDSAGDWLELTKDIVAISNSGGGFVLIGCLDNGHAVGVDQHLTSCLDPALLADKVYRYTGVHLSGLRTISCRKETKTLTAVQIPAAEFPMPFTKVGTYAIEANKQRTAFSQGTLYFRHSAKSEPANSDDLRKFVEHKVEQVKAFWLGGIIESCII
jgi:predicted HTH transcriptional regulator